MDQKTLRNNTSSSIADLKILNEREKDLLKIIKVSKFDIGKLQLQLEEDGYSMNSILHSDVYNPIDSYNLIKRTARTWPKIRNLLEKDNLDESIIKEVDSALAQFPSWEHSRIASALGLLNIQIYYDLDPADLVNGKVEDKLYNKLYKAETKLSVGDVKLIAQVAKDENHLNSAIKWLAVFPQFRKRYNKLVTLHNDLITDFPDEVVKNEVFTFNETVDESLYSGAKLSEFIKKGRSQCPPFQGSEKEEKIQQN